MPNLNVPSRVFDFLKKNDLMMMSSDYIYSTLFVKYFIEIK